VPVGDLVVDAAGSAVVDAGHVVDVADDAGVGGRVLLGAGRVVVVGVVVVGMDCGAGGGGGGVGPGADVFAVDVEGVVGGSAVWVMVSTRSVPVAETMSSCRWPPIAFRQGM
jgi:hypothetical protein